MTEAVDHQLEPLPYHVELRDYLKSREGDLWRWFASAQAQMDYTANLRLALLKSTYRLDPEGHPELYEAVSAARARLQLDIPVTLYQAQNSPHPNATLFYIPGEGHIVFSGALLNILNAGEVQSVIGHELAHHLLWNQAGGEFHVADRVVQAVANDPRAAACHIYTARRYQLYIEIFADRGSLQVTGDIHPVVAGLVKAETGFAQVNAQSYLRQAEEIFSQGDQATEGMSHPEAFIRTRSLALWRDQGPNAAREIAAMIEGRMSLDELDILGQVRLTTITRRLLEQFLRPRWLRTPAALGHAKLYFDDFKPAEEKAPAMPEDFTAPDPRMREYLSYVLLDFATVDPELEDLPLAAALEFSKNLEWDEALEKLAARELKMKVRDLRRLKEKAAELLAKAEVPHA